MTVATDTAGNEARRQENILDPGLTKETRKPQKPLDIESALINENKEKGDKGFGNQEIVRL